MSSQVPGTSKTSSPASPSPGLGVGTTRGRVTRARKRKRIPSESSSDTEPVLPENLLEVEKNLHASAVKNNLDHDSVKKILKTVVTNDHVLALVKLQEEEEQNAMETDSPKPQLTRAKVKELKKVSPKTTCYLGLTSVDMPPIKRIPVKTRPEVSALISQELPEDEDDEEYEPTHDDVPSDDDHTLESCSDVDSQPRTPATPRRAASPRILKDGPFKVPQEVTPRRKLDMDEDATIALRTRSKLSLSSIPIDHIESSFVPPDDLPMPAADDVWTDFLHDCLNPDTEAPDDDNDPEYDVAKDPDAHDEDEEGLENIIKISKKELNDLVTELFNVMPENLDTVLSGKLAGEPAAQNSGPIQSSSWDGKQEPVSDEETPLAVQAREKRLSIGKSEPIDNSECRGESEKENRRDKEIAQKTRVPLPTQVTMSVVEGEMEAYPAPTAQAPPAPLQSLLVQKQTLTVQIQPGAKVLPEQIQILQQQLRQHIQLAASNFMQLFAHPVHWSLAPNYKEYLETLYKMTQDNPKSVANVCNLKPAVDLVQSWEKSVSKDTPENKKMIEFVQAEIERGRRRAAQSCLYVGDFHPTFLNVVSNSPVFLYPYLLPPVPYRSDGVRKFNYVRSEDQLIAIGIEQFWHYVDSNPDLFKVRVTNANARAGLINTVQLVIKHMFPWMTPKAMLNHIKHVKKHFKSNEHNPINKFFATGDVTPVKHTLLPYNPNLTLYEQPENEMPKIWIKHLAKSSQRFQDHLFRRTTYLNRVGAQPAGVPVDLGTAVTPPTKKPLPIAFTQQLAPKPADQDMFDEQTTTSAPQNVIYSVIQTSAGAFLLPVTLLTNSDGATIPISSTEESETISSNLPEESTVSKVSVTVPVDCAQVKKLPILTANSEHCACCIVLRNISKRQSLITDFFKTPIQKSCPCKLKRKVKYPTATRKLRLLVNNYKSKSALAWHALNNQMKLLMNEMRYGSKKSMVATPYSLEEITAVMSFQLKLTIRSNIARNIYTKRRIHSLMAKFNPDSGDIIQFTAQVEKILGTEAVDVYNEFLSFLTMEQADKMGRYREYFKQECLVGLMKKVEELVPNKQHKHNILKCAFNLLADNKLTACEICTKLLDASRQYTALCDYVFSLFPHTRFPKCIEKEKKIPFGAPAAKKKAKKQSSGPEIKAKKDNVDPLSTNNVEENKSDAQAKDNTEHPSENPEANTEHPSENPEANIDKLSKDAEAADIEEHSKNAESIDNIDGHNNDPDATDNIEDHNNDSNVTDNVDDETDPLCRDNAEDETYDDSQTMDYEADHSDSDDDVVENLTIIEDPEEAIQAQLNHVKNERDKSENVIDTPDLTITKTEVQDPSESDMSMMVMSEDDTSIVKTEPTEWKRDEDKRLLEVLQQSLTPEEIKDKTILEIIEQKKVLKLAAEHLPEKSLDEVRERILYLLEFLVASQQATSPQ